MLPGISIPRHLPSYLRTRSICELPVPGLPFPILYSTCCHLHTHRRSSRCMAFLSRHLCLVRYSFPFPSPIPSATAISAPTGHDQNKRFGVIYGLVLLNSLPTSLTWPNPGYTGPAVARSKAGQILISGIQQRKDVHMARVNSK